MRAFPLFACALLSACSISDARFTGRDGNGPPGDGGLGDAPPGDGSVDAMPGPVTLVVPQTSFNVAEGQSISFTVALAEAPSSEVAVALAPSGAIASIAPAALSFTAADFNQPKTVTVTSVADADFDFAAGAVQISAERASPVTASLRVIEPEIIELTPTLGAVCPGESFGAAVRLKGDPRGTLVVNAAPLSSGSVNPPTLTFESSNFGTQQFVDMSGEVAGTSVFFGFSSPGVTARQFRLTVRSPGSPACFDEPPV